MTYDDYRRLLLAATEFDTLEDYIADEGGAISETHTIPLLKRLYAFAHDKSMATLRRMTGLTQTAFADKYSIPRRSIQNWEAVGHKSGREMPPYVLDLLGYAVVMDEMDNNIGRQVTLYIVRDTGNGTDVCKAFFDIEAAREEAKMIYYHLTKKERETDTVAIEGYPLTLQPGDARDAETLFNDLLDEDDERLYNAMEYEVITSEW